MSNEFKTVPEMQILAAKVPQAHDGEAVYQLHDGGNLWLDVSYEAFNYAPSDQARRIVHTAPPRVVDVDGERYRKLVATGSFTPALNPERTPWGLRMSGTPATKQELDSAVDAMEAK